MYNTQSRAIWKFKLAEEFAEVRGTLVSGDYAGRLNTPLLQWTVLEDRPLPVPFLDASLEGLLDTPFDELFDTPGVGHKKIATLLRVLRRVAGIAEPEAAQSGAPSKNGNSWGSTLELELRDLCARAGRARQTLLCGQWDVLLAKPLRHWAMPRDRQLPSVFLGHSLAELLAIPWDRLIATPCVGPKKIAMLVELLERAAASVSPRRQAVDSEPAPSGPPDSDLRANLTEATWTLWRTAVVRSGAEQETLGRLARSLSDLARSLWNVPLGEFTGLTLQELEAREGLSRKRVRNVLETFADLQRLLATLGPQPDHLTTRIVPRSAARLGTWAALACTRPTLPTPAEIEAELVEPLLAQLRIDLGDRAARLASWRRRFLAGRIGFPIRSGGARLALASRSHYLINEARAVIAVRWPEGADWMARLRARFDESGAEPLAVLALESAAHFFFHSAAGPVAASVPHSAVPERSRPRERALAAGHRGPTSSDFVHRSALEAWPRTHASEQVGLAYGRKP